MKKNNVLTWMLALTIILAGVSTVVAEYSFETNGNNGKSVFTRPGGGFIGAKLLKSAFLSDEQKKEVVAVLIQYLPEIKIVLGEISVASKNMADVARTEGVTQEAVLEAYRQLSAEKEAMVVIVFEIATQLKDVLTLDQQETVKKIIASLQEKKMERFEKKLAMYEGFLHGLSE